MAEYLSVKHAARRLGIGERALRLRCEKARVAGATKEMGFWLVPVSADARLAESPPPKVAAGELEDIPAGRRIEAQRRLGLLRGFEQFAAGYCRGARARTLAVSIYCARNKIAVRTFRRWMRWYREEGLAGLVDHRGGEACGSQISGEAWELFKTMYLTEQRLSVAVCRRNVAFINKRDGKGWMIPSAGTLYRLVEKEIPLPVRVLHREGLGAYNAKCGPYIQTDPDSVEPGTVWIGDHSQFNCWIRHRGQWVRPWITAWQDMRSRAIVGRHIAARPNQTTILLAAKRGMEKYGPPEAVKIDNGRDYDSQMWTGVTKKQRRALRAGYIDEAMTAGIFGMLDVTVSFAIPYSPQSKGRMERFFDTLDRQFTATLPTYCGKDTKRRPEDLYKWMQTDKAIREAHDLASFAEMVGRYIEAYNNSPHTGAGMNGKAPADVLASRSSRRVLADGVLQLLMRVWSPELTVGKNGVRFRGMYYGQYEPILLVYQGRKVRAAYDPDDLRSVQVYDAATMKLIVTAEQNRLVQYGRAVDEETLRDAMRQKSRARRLLKGYVDSRRAANMDLTNLTIAAMEDAAQQRREEIAAPPAGPATIRPVRTALDGQSREHERQKIIKHLKRAAGAEGVTEALDLDFSLLARPKTERLDFDFSPLARPEREKLELEP